MHKKYAVLLALTIFLFSFVPVGFPVMAADIGKTVSATEAETTSEEYAAVKEENSANSATDGQAASDRQSETDVESAEEDEDADSRINAQSSIWSGWSGNSYYINGRRLINTLKTIDGKKYYFNSSGSKVKNVFVTVNGNTYYFSSDGSAATDQMETIGSKTYIFDTNSVMLTCSFYTGSNGQLFYAGKDGAILKSCWAQINGYYYYFASDGHADKDESRYNIAGNVQGFTYDFGSDGKLITKGGWTTKNSRTYYWASASDTSGSNITIIKVTNRSVSYTTFNTGVGHRYSGWQTIDGNRYYFSTSDGHMYKTWSNIDGKLYNFGSNGKMLTGWQTIDGSRYYFSTSDGHMYKTWSNIGGKLYNFGSNGKMLTGWQTIDGSRYYFSTSDGHMYKTWSHIGGKLYNFGSNGKMLTGWQTIDGKRYFFGSDGHAYKSWSTINGKKYYFDPSGYYLVAGTTRTIGNKKYTFNSDGTIKSESYTDDIQGYTSNTNYLVVVKKNSKKVTVYQKKNGSWTAQRSDMLCTVGHLKNGKSVTPTGHYRVIYKKYVMNFEKSSAFYASWTNGGMGIHSILYTKYSKSPKNVFDGRLGYNLSKGCVRLSLSNAKWVYDNVPVGSTVELLNK